MPFSYFNSFLTRTEKGCFLGQILSKSAQTHYYGVEFVKTNTLRPSFPGLEFPSSSYEFCKFSLLMAFAVFN